jgi:hypothetical protein
VIRESLTSYSKSFGTINYEPRELFVKLLCLSSLLLLNNFNDLIVWPYFMTCSLLLLSNKIDRNLLILHLIAYTFFSINEYAMMDNHKYLLLYINIILVQFYNSEKLKNASMQILGLIFCFAATWKVISIDFLTGKFIQDMMIMDNRFYGLTNLFCEYPLEKQNLNFLLSQKAIVIRETGQVISPNSEIHLNTCMKALSLLTVVYTIVIEWCIGIGFLLKERLPEKYTDVPFVLLLIFILTIYSFVPVTGFSGILLSFGVFTKSSKLKKVFLGIFFFQLFISAYYG